MWNGNELRSRFERDGYVKAGSVLDPDELQQLSERVNAIAAGESVGGATVRIEKHLKDASHVPQRDRVFQIIDGHLAADAILAICKHERILDVVEALIGIPIRLYSDQVLMKPAMHGSEVPWHQDFPYWSFDRPELISCWLAIDAATIENSCMRVIPGSHKQGVLPIRADRRIRDQDQIQAAQEVCVELPAGHCMFHHCLTLHATSLNRSPRSRRAISITYMPADLKWIGDPAQKREYRDRDYLLVR